MDALASGRPHMLEVAITSVAITIRDTKCVRTSLPACARGLPTASSSHSHRVCVPTPTRWVPSTARFVTVGNHMRDTGALHVRVATRTDSSALFLLYSLTRSLWLRPLASIGWLPHRCMRWTGWT